MKNKPAQEVNNNLSAIREQRGLSASALAKMTGVSRQTIYAMEAGSFVPNTTVGLRLARALGVRVEDLFSLPEPRQPAATESVTLLPSLDEPQPGQPVQVCEVDGRLVAAPAAPFWYLPPSDGVMSGRPSAHGKAKVQLYEQAVNFQNRLLLAGCDPAMAMIARYLQPRGIDLVLLHQNSSQALSLLKRGLVHIAGCHLRDEATGELNVRAITGLFPADSVAAISFALWQEGLLVAHGNAKDIEGVQDLDRKEVNFLNRESGSGSRVLLDSYLRRLKLDSRRVRGYDRIAAGHLAAAWEVKTGSADCCIANQAAARAFGLDFIPLETSRFDLVVRKKDLNLPAAQAFFEVMNRASFRSELKNVVGYDTAVTGDRVL